MGPKTPQDHEVIHWTAPQGLKMAVLAVAVDSNVPLNLDAMTRFGMRDNSAFDCDIFRTSRFIAPFVTLTL